MSRIEEIIIENQKKLDSSKLPPDELFTLLTFNCMEQYGKELLVKGTENANNALINGMYINISDAILNTKL